MNLLRRPGHPRLAARFHRLFGRGNDERGAFAVLAAIVLTIMIFSTALAMDLMGRVTQLRQDQALADVTALDAARGLSSFTALADLTSKECQNFGLNAPCTIPSNVVTTYGNAAHGQCTLTNPLGCLTPDQVTATVSSTYHDFFGGTIASLSRSAVAGIGTIVRPCSLCSPASPGTAQFSIGTSLVMINENLDRFLGSGNSANLTAVGYQGLVTGSISLSSLATQLGFSFVTASDVLNHTITVGSLLNSYSSLLNSNGDTNAGAALGALRANLLTNNTAAFNASLPLYTFLGLQSGTGMALGTSISFLQLVSGAAQVANGAAGISVGVSVPGVSNVAVTAITPPTVSANAGIGTQATNTQITVTAQVLASNLVLGAVGNVTLTITLGGATGTLDAIDCTSSGVTDIKLGTAFSNAKVVLNPTTLVNLLGLQLVTIGGNVSVPGNPPASDATVVDSANFAQTTPQTVVTASSPSVGTITNNLTVGVLGASLSTGGLLGALNLTGAGGLLTAIENSTILSGDGITIGNASYLGMQASCAQAAGTGPGTTSTTGPVLLH